MIGSELIGAVQDNAAFFLNSAGCFKPKADGTLGRQKEKAYAIFRYDIPFLHLCAAKWAVHLKIPLYQLGVA